MILHLAHMALYGLTFVCQKSLGAATTGPLLQALNHGFPAGILHLAHMVPYEPTFGCPTRFMTAARRSWLVVTSSCLVFLLCARDSLFVARCPLPVARRSWLLLARGLLLVVPFYSFVARYSPFPYHP